MDLVVVNNNLNKTNLAILKEKELDLFMAICLKLREEGTKKIELDLSELKDLSKYEGKDNQRFISDIKNVNKKLLKLYCEYETENEIGVFVLFTDYTIYKKEKKLVIQVNEKFKYILNELTENFTKFELNQFVNLTSQYSKNIFRLLKQFSETGWREFLLSDFRELLNIPQKYRISEIDKYVLNEKILKELGNNFKNLKVIKLKNGRSVYKLRFEWEVEKKKGKEIEVLPKTSKEKSTDKLLKKQLEAIELAEITSKEFNEKYNNFLELSEEIKRKIEEIIYNNFLESSNSTDNKISKGIFEKSKKSLIVEEYEEILEELEKEDVSQEIKIIETDEKILEEPKQTLENFEEENPIGWEQPLFIIEPKTELTEVELEAKKIIDKIFPFLDDDLIDEDINYVRATLRRKKMYKELEILDLFLETQQAEIVDKNNIFKDEKCLGLSEFGKDYVENYIKENNLEHLLISEKTKKELKGSARENRLIKLYKNNFKAN